MVLNPKIQAWYPFADTRLFLQSDISRFDAWCMAENRICVKCRSRVQVCALPTVYNHSFRLCHNVLNTAVMNEVLAYDDLRSFGSIKFSLNDTGCYISYPKDICSSSQYRVISASLFTGQSHCDVSIPCLSDQEDMSTPSSPKRVHKTRSRNDSQKGHHFSSCSRSSIDKINTVNMIESISSSFGTKEFQEFFRQSAIAAIYDVSDWTNTLLWRNIVSYWFRCCSGPSADMIWAERCLGNEAVSKDGVM